MKLPNSDCEMEIFVSSAAVDVPKLPNRKKHSLCGSIRLLIAFLTFFGTCMISGMRGITSMAIVCMINHTSSHQSIHSLNSKNTSSECDWTGPYENETETNFLMSSVQDGEFSWSKEIQGHIHASVWWGYTFSQLPGALIGYKIGSRNTAGGSVLMSGIITILCPIAARYHYTLLIGLRFLNGLAMGIVVPQIYKLFAKWSPPNERSILIGLSLGGLSLGTSLALGISSLFCQFGRWDLIFYTFGSSSLVWFVIWMLVVTDDPGENKFITKKEIQYLSQNMTFQKKSGAIPWVSILKSRPVWAIYGTMFLSNSFQLTFESNVPTYLNDQLGLSPFLNGVVSFSSYMAFGILFIIIGVPADAIIASKRLSTTTVRKMSVTLALLVPAFLNVMLATIPPTCDNLLLQIILIGISVASVGAKSSGQAVNAADLAPEFSGIVFSISNALASIPGFVCPILVGYVTKHNYWHEWSLVFYICAGINTLGWLIFMIWGSGELQPWANSTTEPTKNLNPDTKTENI